MVLSLVRCRLVRMEESRSVGKYCSGKITLTWYGTVCGMVWYGTIYTYMEHPTIEGDVDFDLEAFYGSPQAGSDD